MPARVRLPGGELTLIGAMSELQMQRVGVLRLPWLEDKPCEVLMGRNGRPRAAITLPGYGAGRKPGNAGRKFPPEPLSNEEALALLAKVPAGTVIGVRNLALLTLLWRTGLRVSEALDLCPHHVDFQGRRVTVLHGKGDKRRTVGIDDGGLHALQPWLFARARLSVDLDAPLFCTVQRPGRGNRIHPNYVRDVLRKYAKAAAIPKRVHPHGFRHTLACDLVHEGFSLPDVQAQLGHNNVATTATYLKGLGADQAFDRVAGRSWPGGAR